MEQDDLSLKGYLTRFINSSYIQTRQRAVKYSPTKPVPILASVIEVTRCILNARGSYVYFCDRNTQCKDERAMNATARTEQHEIFLLSNV